jgi:hypothetical protein
MIPSLAHHSIQSEPRWKAYSRRVGKEGAMADQNRESQDSLMVCYPYEALSEMELEGFDERDCERVILLREERSP